MAGVSEATAVQRETPAELITRGRALLRGFDVAAAMALAAEAEAAAHATGDRSVLAEALLIVATCRRYRDEYPEALTAALRAVELFRGLGLPAAEARARGEVARLLVSSGEPAEALPECLTALELAEAGGDLGAFVPVLTALGCVYLALQQLDLALEACERGAETARLIGDEYADGILHDTAACVLLAMAEQARANGDEEGAVRVALEATERSRAAMVIARRHGNRRHEATAVANLAEGLSLAGHAENALATLESWQLDPSLDTTYTITHHLDTRGLICLTLDRHDEAIALFTRAIEIAESKSAAMMSCEHLAAAYEQGGDVAAALAAYKKFHHLFREVVSEAAQRNARVAAVRLETDQAKARAEEERRRADSLQRVALEDPLTGLANRRHLDEQLIAGVAGRAVALIDVDRFKRVNDSFSHQVGDEVLRRLAGLLRAGCRDADLVARHGGEEFAVLLHELSTTEAMAATERIRHAVETYPWDDVAPGLVVTVSIGVAVGAESGDAAELLALADRRLYAAKNSGRNRVIGRSNSGSRA
ncbi:GGDEF domain-containing protein [Actinoplanes sp. NPDC051861]|uniref:GGDEF domain-containing protein n=1 Tax=Actinoplanes sp. NPDC051861 TaxID=3155170 RepID=UPI0034368095